MALLRAITAVRANTIPERCGRVRRRRAQQREGDLGHHVVGIGLAHAGPPRLVAHRRAQAALGRSSWRATGEGKGGSAQRDRRRVGTGAHRCNRLIEIAARHQTPVGGIVRYRPRVVDLCWYDAGGRPLHVAASPPAAFALLRFGAAFLAEVAPPELVEGDVWIVNAPWIGGSTLADVRLARLHGERLLAASARWPAIGACAPDEGPSELLHEGLVLPPLPLARPSTTALLRANVEPWEQVQPLIEAQLAALAGAGEPPAPAERERAVDGDLVGCRRAAGARRGLRHGRLRAGRASVTIDGVPPALGRPQNATRALVEGALAWALLADEVEVAVPAGSALDPPRWAPVGGGPAIALALAEGVRAAVR